MNFRDDYPLDPLPLPLAEDWAKPINRNPHDSLEEVRATLGELSDLLFGMGRETITTADGRMIEVLARTVGTDPVLQPWDLAPVAGLPPGRYEVYRPLIVQGRIDVTGMVAVTNTPFTPEPDKFLVLEIDAIPVTSATVALDSNWDEYPNAYKFGDADPWSFEKARIPVWRFYAEDGPVSGSRIQFGANVYGEKLVSNAALQVVYTIVEVPNENRVRTVPDLV